MKRKLIQQLLVYAAMTALILPTTLGAAQAEKAAAHSGKAVHGAGSTAAKTTRMQTTVTGSAQRAAPTVSESEIAASKASGKVWVNTETGVYHKGGQWYGATKQGKFMTENEAIKGGYRASKSKEK